MADDVQVAKRRLDASENEALIGMARMGADAFGYTADLRIDRRLAQSCAGEPPERIDVSAGGLVRVDPGTALQSRTRATKTCSFTPTAAARERTRGVAGPCGVASRSRA